MWLKRNAKHAPTREGRYTYWHDDDIAAYQKTQAPLKSGVSVSDMYKTDSLAYKRTLKWLNNNAKHEPVRKGRKIYWHDDDIAALKAFEPERVQWQNEIHDLFATPCTIYDALDVLAEQNVFPEVDAARVAIHSYERKGLLRRVGKRGKAIVYEVAR